jgi:hypothetical protein
VRLAEAEHAALAALLDGKARAVSHRHHLFVRRAMHVRRVTAVLLGTRAAPATPFRRTGVLALLIRAGEEAADEARAQRIDTLPVALALLGVYARWHALLHPGDEARLAVHAPASVRAAFGEPDVPKAKAPAGNIVTADLCDTVAAAAAQRAERWDDEARHTGRVASAAAKRALTEQGRAAENRSEASRVAELVLRQPPADGDQAASFGSRIDRLVGRLTGTV